MGRGGHSQNCFIIVLDHQNLVWQDNQDPVKLEFFSNLLLSMQGWTNMSCRFQKPDNKTLSQRKFNSLQYTCVNNLHMMVCIRQFLPALLQWDPLFSEILVSSCRLGSWHLDTTAARRCCHSTGGNGGLYNSLPSICLVQAMGQDGSMWHVASLHVGSQAMAVRGGSLMGTCAPWVDDRTLVTSPDPTHRYRSHHRSCPSSLAAVCGWAVAGLGLLDALIHSGVSTSHDGFFIQS